MSYTMNPSHAYSQHRAANFSAESWALSFEVPSLGGAVPIVKTGRAGFDKASSNVVAIFRRKKNKKTNVGELRSAKPQKPTTKKNDETRTEM
jgi:hypothetical protein